MMNLSRRSILQGSLCAGVGMVVPLKVWGLTQLGGHAFGSYWRVVIGENADLHRVSEAVGGIVAETDAAMSPYRADSELTQVNVSNNRDWMPLSNGLAAVLQEALRTAAASKGAFDPTVGPYVGQLGFGPIRGMRTGDAGDLEVRRGALRKHRSGLSVDLCGIAKGWALDRIVEALEALGARDFLVELGGEVGARGKHPDDRPWRIMVDGTNWALELGDMAVATSGNTVQGYTIGGHRYGHIIDPGNGQPAAGDLLSVSVIAATGMAADAWATALYVRGTDGALDMAEANGLEAVLAVRAGPGTDILTTGGAERRLLR